MNKFKPGDRVSFCKTIQYRGTVETTEDDLVYTFYRELPYKGTIKTILDDSVYIIEDETRREMQMNYKQCRKLRKKSESACVIRNLQEKLAVAVEALEQLKGWEMIFGVSGNHPFSEKCINPAKEALAKISGDK